MTFGMLPLETAAHTGSEIAALPRESFRLPRRCPSAPSYRIGIGGEHRGVAVAETPFQFLAVISQHRATIGVQKNPLHGTYEADVRVVDCDDQRQLVVVFRLLACVGAVPQRLRPARRLRHQLVGVEAAAAQVDGCRRAFDRDTLAPDFKAAGLLRSRVGVLTLALQPALLPLALQLGAIDRLQSFTLDESHLGGEPHRGIGEARPSVLITKPITSEWAPQP